MNISDTDLKEYLLEHDIITKKELTKIKEDAEKHETTLAEALMHTGTVSEEKIRQAQAVIQNVPFIDLADVHIDPDIVTLIPEPLAKKQNIIAFKKEDDSLHVAMLDAGDVGVIDLVRKTVGSTIIPYVTTTESLQSALLQYRKSLNVEFQEIIHQAVSSVSTAHGEVGEDASLDELKKIAEDLPIIQIVDTLISHAILQNASDIHIEPEEDSLIVRYRVDGILHDAMTLPKNITAGVIVRIKILANLRLDEKRLPQDGRFKKTYDDQDISFRVSTLPTYFGEKVVLRLLGDSAHDYALEDLGLHGEALERVHDALKQKTGLILVSGPTGSGKTTTLYTLLDILNTPDVNISTVEDPIEYQVDRINQTQVKPDIGLTFASGLRSLLRQDPDILMVGEIRDTETVSLAVNASLTGHLVLSTIHTNSAAGVIPRMMDMGVETFLITSTVKVLTAQRLVRVLCDDKEPYTLSENERKELEEVADMDRVLKLLKKEKIVGAKDRWDMIQFYRAKPNGECDTGYSGRIGIHEVVKLSDNLKQIIINGGSEANISKAAMEEGMMTMVEDGIFKAVQGITTTEEVLRVISN